MNKKNLIIDMGADNETLFADGFEDAIVGLSNESVVVYDIDKMIDILIEQDKMTYEEAVEYLEFNTLGAYVGKYTPIYIHTVPCNCRVKKLEKLLR